MVNTKIVATLGPATSSKQKLAELVDAGMDVARLNFSHVDRDAHLETFETIRQVSEKTAVMADTKGPEIRLGEVEEGTVLENGHVIEIHNGEDKSNAETLYINHDGLFENIEPGDEIRIDDGIITLEVERADKIVEATVIYGGKVSDRKAVNVPSRDIGLQAPTKKDREDIEFAAKHGFDFISLSFVKKAEDVKKTRQILERSGSEAQIISKIEHEKAVENFDEILEASDAIMVARGDLGVELPAAEVPRLQKEIIEKCNKAGKPVITATQMLESMTESPTATRAEISDVANAIMDGTDAVMLSGETAIGSYPIKAVETMKEISEAVEDSIRDKVHHTVKEKSVNRSEVICKNVWQASRDIEALCIVIHTTSGSTARNISKYRPAISIVAFTDTEVVERQLNLVWGVKPFYQEFPENVEDMIVDSAERLKNLGISEGEDKIILSAGVPTSITGTTNMMQIRTMRELL